MVGLSYGATSLFTTCSVLEIWWLKLQLKSCSEMGVPVLRPPEFSTPYGLFQFRVMPFGLCNAPSTFQRLMELVLTGLHWSSCLVYIDDIIIFSSMVQEHFQRLLEVFERLRSAGLKVKPSKNVISSEELWTTSATSSLGRECKLTLGKLKVSPIGHPPTMSRSCNNF